MMTLMRVTSIESLFQGPMPPREKSWRYIAIDYHLNYVQLDTF